MALKGSDWMEGVASKVIDGKAYLFDENGKMLTGLYYLSGVKRTGSSPLGYVPYGEDCYYYFQKMVRHIPPRLLMEFCIALMALATRITRLTL